MCEHSIEAAELKSEAKNQPWRKLLLSAIATKPFYCHSRLHCFLGVRCSQGTRTKVTAVTAAPIIHCMFSNACLKRLNKMIQSCIVCICLTFLQCVFTNVSSNRQLEIMHSHIDCICLTFLHCAFSNVSANGLPERMQSHTGCICLAFLHCAFPSVYSKSLGQRRQSHTGCIFLCAS